VSRTPVRAALRSLAHEGLLEQRHGGGFVIREFTPGDVYDVIEVRAALEGTAARMAAERLDSDDELEPLREQCRELDAVVRSRTQKVRAKYVALNDAFHRGFHELAKSREVMRAIEHALALPFATPSALVRVRPMCPRARDLAHVAQRQHHALLEAIARGEGAHAETIASQHARIARQRLDIALDSRQLLEHVPGSSLLVLRDGNIGAGRRTSSPVASAAASSSPFADTSSRVLPHARRL
jgi:GntR family transcriptional regulator of vanillate catabolism